MYSLLPTKFVFGAIKWTLVAASRTNIGAY